MSVRRSRTALIVATVALSSALIAAVACAMASVHKGVRMRVEQTVGAADVRLSRIGKDPFEQNIVDQIRAWPETRLAVARLGGAIALKNTSAAERNSGSDVPSDRSSDESEVKRANIGDDTDPIISTIGWGYALPEQWQLFSPPLEDGRLLSPAAPGAAGEILIDTTAAEELRAQVGDTLEVQLWGSEPLKLTLVGITRPPPLGTLSKPESYVALSTMQAINQTPGMIREVDILLNDSRHAEAVATAHQSDFAPGMVLRAGSKVVSGLQKNLESSQLGMRIASVLAFLAASFIIMTGLTTNVTERQRELAVVRCIGGTKFQLAETQLLGGLIVGVLGAIIGIPLGMLGAFALISYFHERLPGGFVVNWSGLLTAFAGCIGAGLIGAAWPALKAARTSPLEALAIRSRKPRLSGLLLCFAVGAALAGVHLLIFILGSNASGSAVNADRVFWLDVTIGAPAIFAGYFFMAVPVTLVIALALGPILSRILGLPRNLLSRTIAATPYRVGFTAAAMAMGLSLLVGIWTNGRAVMRDWLGSLEFPDAFVAGLSLSERTRDRIENLPFVTGAAAVSIQTLKTDAFGLKAFDNATTTFIGFDPEPFFAMTKLSWVEGNQADALAALKAGGAILVAREFKVARGLGVGDTLTLSHDGTPHTFKIVGVVNSPGLDIASRFFSIGDDYLNNAVNGVFGSRDDLKRIFGHTGIQLIQVGIDPAYDDKEAIKQIRRLAGFEVISAGSGREIKNEIRGFLSSTLFIFSLVAIGAMLVACTGVANLIVASIQARQFEFGVLRAIGGSPGVLRRLVMGEAFLIALGACIMGTLMGIQISWAGQKMYELVLGISLTMQLDKVADAIAGGWATVIAITLIAAFPAVYALSRKHPRELLGAVKG